MKPVVVAILFGMIGAANRANAASAWIAGTIANSKSGSVSIADRTVPLDEKGGFRLALDLANPAYQTIRCGDTAVVFLTPGDSLTLTADATDLVGTLHFDGLGALANNFLAEEARRQRRQSADIERAIGAAWGLADVQFAATLDSMRTEWENPLDEFLRLHPDVDPLYRKCERARILYPWADIRLAHAAVGPPGDGAQMRFLGELDFNDPDLLVVSEYTSFVGTYITYLARRDLAIDRDLQKADNQLTTAKLRAAKRTFANPIVLCHWLTAIVQGHLDDFGIKGMEGPMADLRGRCSDQIQLSGLTARYFADSLAWADHEVRVYKTVGTITLDAHIFRPPKWTPKDKRPAIVFFHGAGWYMGTPEWTFNQCQYWRDHGLVAIGAQYRLIDRHGSTPADAIADAKSILRWLRKHADSLGVDPNRIVAAGWSAGGHLAASAAILAGFNDRSDDTTISAVPNALMLTFPALDLTQDAWFQKNLRGRATAEDCSPSHHVRPGLPPTVIFQGTEDDVCPYTEAVAFTAAMKAAGNRCDLHTFDGRGHLFTRNPEDRAEVLRLSGEFLRILAYLSKSD